MTVVVGRTQIHLGWPVAVSILIAVICATFVASGIFYSTQRDIKDLKDDSRENRELILSFVKRDSVQNSRLDALSGDMRVMRITQDDHSRQIAELQSFRAPYPRTKYVTAMRTATGIIFKPYKN